MKPRLQLVLQSAPVQEPENEPFMVEGLALSPIQIAVLRRIDARMRALEDRVGTIATHCPIARRIERGEQ